ncbi:hypothetical protein Q7Z55_09565 [Glaesserella parasuis]|uniref:Uncharacterized protein n=1 Tax=Glaesserella parasuis TaxID=738 RepID=A0A6I5WMT6_GLAPU|nr:hypothetical protein [Glaesserella parasuis]ATW45360.1 hypothetical protein A2U21_05155 [Glaesserella parasuis str. Nagasaki]AWY45451.1 hypothetical protein B4U42_05455 [Glaesserella parasuis 29755]EQA03352.1 hypothetical protein HPSNAG_0531 [Glaesserella parasuis str. Nagasaki]EQA09995.1 hypothetical protein HPS8415995_0586 [Glaesserella parasuis 84-15995]EQA95979.1 hypothetical protein HPS_0495 [Glaesserella parasuis 29755]
MKKSFTEKAKSLKGVSLAMGIFTSFFSQDTQATQQNDVQNLMQQVKQTSQILVHQNVDERYFFSVLSQLNETIALLNDVVRSMSKPEKVINDLIFIDTGLNSLAQMVRQKYIEFLRNNISERTIFKHFTAEVFKFSVFTEKMREKTNHYSIVPSKSNFTQADLDELVTKYNG